MATDLYKLQVKLEAESAQLRSELDKVNGRLSKFERGATRSLQNFSKVAKAAFGIFTVGAVAAATRSAVSFADSIDKSAQKAGLSASALQEFRFAGEQVGVSTKNMDDGFRRLTRRLGEFANSGGGPAAKALESLNVAVTDTEGKMRPTEAVFDDIISKMEGIESQAQRSALAAQLFGDDAGPELELLLKQGTAGIEELRAAARATGGVLSDELIANGAAAQDAMSRLSFAFTGAANSIILQLAPQLEGLADFLAVNIPSAIQVTGESFRAFRHFAIEGAQTINTFLSKVAEGFQVLADAAGLDEVAQSFANVRQEYASTAEQLEELQRAYALAEGSQSKFRAGATRPAFDPINAPGAGDIKGDDSAAKAAAKAQEEFEKSLQSLLDKLDPVSAKTRDYMSSVELLNRAWAEGQISGQEYDRLMGELASNTDDATSAQVEQREAMEALLRSTIDAVDPTARLVSELEALDELMRSDVGEGFGDVIMERMLQIHEEMDGLAGKTEEVTKEMSVFADQAARNMQDSLADFLFDPFDQGVKGMVKGFADALRRMLAEAAAAKVFESIGGKAGSGGVAGFLADMIPGFAMGTNYAPGGLALVGERGPELVTLPRGSKVTPNNQLAGNTYNVSVHVPPGSSADSRRAAAQGARDGVESIRRAQRYA